MERQQPNSLVGSRPQHQQVSNHLRFPMRDEEIGGLVASKPNSVSGNPSPQKQPKLNPVAAQRLSCTRTTPTTGVAHLHESPRSPNPHTMWAGHRSRGAP